MKTLTKRMAAASKLAPKNFSLKNFSYTFRNERGAFDLPSILVGVLVVAVMALGVMAVVFGIIPFAQDKSAQQALAAVATAEGTYYGQSSDAGTIKTNAYVAAVVGPPAVPASSGGASFAGLADLKTEKLLGQDANGIDVQGGDKGWVAVAKSDSNTWYWATNENPSPVKIATQPAATATAATVLSTQAGLYTPAKIGTTNPAGVN